jgi:hypothetical protein
MKIEPKDEVEEVRVHVIHLSLTHEEASVLYTAAELLRTTKGIGSIAGMKTLGHAEVLELFHQLHRGMKDLVSPWHPPTTDNPDQPRELIPISKPNPFGGANG